MIFLKKIIVLLKYYAPEPISKPNQAGIDVGQSYTPTTSVFTQAPHTPGRVLGLA
jgi:hypothetical protein